MYKNLNIEDAIRLSSALAIPNRICWGNSRLHLPNKRLEDKLTSIRICRRVMPNLYTPHVIDTIIKSDPIPVINVGSIIINERLLNGRI